MSAHVFLLDHLGPAGLGLLGADAIVLFALTYLSQAVLSP
ncbi:hypothetical protein Nizo2535_0414 [Lactiplantibacillus plantarum]|uniref:Uncharacterized protein n=1 Tax=Lactiplantibacillus plantarum TaxID=1590 RepID=A0A165QYG3_LACPN|nr:hypothetical protein FBR6_1920 [Lactiplantibacillus plantarum]KZU17597.1 hypothetical protein Nizo2484_3008 [Lactiplantibacillus plantarum]KZU29355.1 hypothetical protein Nizo2485_0692 [Lactiplantibacillus plantarum]KZU35587.1 hypothetical protein Nizo2535_0414 [Lactiplantibacillus plantarum]KZU79716.1 hypothetical protein Nizo2891_1467 [Lactiplantibacillus plantarum]